MPVLAASLAVATAGTAPLATTSAATIAAVAAATATTGADRSQLLRGLAGDRGIVGEAQADATALAVDLDHGDVDLLTGGEHVIDRVDTLARLDVGDVQQAVGALDQLDEGAEGGRLDDLGGLVAIADFSLLGHRLDPPHAGFDQGAGRGVDADRAVVFDVDFGFKLLAEGADGFATLADHGADLLLIDLDRLD